MLTTTTEIWPFGDGRQAKRLVTINIANYSKNDDGTTDYLWSIQEPFPFPGQTPIDAAGKLEKWDRNNTCLALLAAVLNQYLHGPSVPLTEAEQDHCRSLAEKNT